MSPDFFEFEHNNDTLDPHEIVALYDDCGWNEDGFRTADRTQLSLGNSLWFCAVYDRSVSELVGFARLVGDGVYVVQLVDLMVKSSYRKRGIAKRIISEITEKFAELNQDTSIMLVDGSGVDNLYSPMGFSSSSSEQVFYQK